MAESLAPPPIIDLFSGCGGMSLGFQRAGFEVLEAFDSWDAAVNTYNANFGHPATLLDLSDTEATFQALERHRSSSRSFPGIIGGPPCQDFSSAGTRVEGARADLTEKFGAVVAHFQPAFFVMENVARAQRSAAFARAVRTMEEAGYVVARVVVNASLYGVPQHRKRLFTFGSKREGVSSAMLEHLLRERADTPITVRQALGDRLNLEAYYRHPRSYSRRGIFSVDEPSPTIRGVNRQIPPGYVQHPGDAAPPSEVRALTTKERAAIQTFPPEFLFTGSRTSAEQMIGNAVPPNLAEAVGRSTAQTFAGAPLIMEA